MFNNLRRSYGLKPVPGTRTFQESNKKMNRSDILDLAQVLDLPQSKYEKFVKAITKLLQGDSASASPSVVVANQTETGMPYIPDAVTRAKAAALSTPGGMARRFFRLAELLRSRIKRKDLQEDVPTDQIDLIQILDDVDAVGSDPLAQSKYLKAIAALQVQGIIKGIFVGDAISQSLPDEDGDGSVSGEQEYLKKVVEQMYAILDAADEGEELEGKDVSINFGVVSARYARTDEEEQRRQILSRQEGE